MYNVLIFAEQSKRALCSSFRASLIYLRFHMFFEVAFGIIAIFSRYDSLYSCLRVSKNTMRTFTTPLFMQKAIISEVSNNISDLSWHGFIIQHSAT